MARDDDIDDLVDELRNTNRNLSRLIDTIERGASREDEGDSQSQYPVDLWDVGRSSENVNDELQYERARMRAANSDGEAVPRYTGDRDRIDFYTDMFTSGLEHLDAINKKLSIGDFDEFIRELAIFYGCERDLVEILEPSSAYFGVDKDRDDNIRFLENRSHFTFVSALGSLWYLEPGMDPATDPITLPWDRLNIGNPTQLENIRDDFNLGPESFIQRGIKDEIEKNVELSKDIRDRDDLDLPQEYFDLF
jgi:hypothetical protein